MKTDLFTRVSRINFKSQIGTHAALSFFLFILFFILSDIIGERHQDTLVNSIQSIFRNDRELGNSAYLSRRIADLETIGMISCVELKSETFGIVYSTAFKDWCNDGNIFFEIFNPTNFVKLKTIEGELVLLRFKSDSNLIFKIYFSLFFILITVIANLLLSLYSNKIKIKNNELNKEQIANKILDLKVQQQTVELIQAKFEIAIRENMATLAKQVAHDIRSPLSALTMVMGSLKEIPEDKRILIRNATQRINDIANDLLHKGQKPEFSDNHLENSSDMTKLGSGAALKLSTEFIPATIDILISEKRMQYREHAGLEIEVDLNNSFGAFSQVNSTELMRVISNLVNNAVEAFQNHQGRITVGVRKISIQNTDKVEIFVKDNGKGIPKHILEKLGQMGVSHGKEGTQSGSGLGVYHAKKTAEAFGGEFIIESAEGRGTAIRIVLPLAEAPKWFANKINLTGKKYLVSLDDDISIHQIWAGRLSSLGLHNIEHLKFQSGEAFEQYVNSNINKLKTTLFLVDYELLNQSKTGLDIIEDLGIEKYTILVTSRYEEDSIQSRASRLKLPILPKALAGFVPFEMEAPKEHFDWVLVDDDELVHLTWDFAAKEYGKAFLGFKTPEQFNAYKNKFDLEQKIFIDSNLAQGIKGEDVARQLYAEGFKNLYIATGYSPDQFPEMEFVKAVVGKEPPQH